MEGVRSMFNQERYERTNEVKFNMRLRFTRFRLRSRRGVSCILMYDISRNQKRWRQRNGTNRVKFNVRLRLRKSDSEVERWR